MWDVGDYDVLETTGGDLEIVLWVTPIPRPSTVELESRVVKVPQHLVLCQDWHPTLLNLRPYLVSSPNRIEHQCNHISLPIRLQKVWT